MNCLQPTPEGAAKIKKAIDDVCNCMVKHNGERRSYQDDIWLEEASKVIDPNWSDSDEYLVTKATWKRFKSGKVRINKRDFIAFCKILKLNWQEIAGVNRDPYPYGFKSPPERRTIFNSYSGKRAIQNLWVDPYWYENGGFKEIKPYIKPEITSTDLDGKFLRLEFIRQGWGLNVTIRPENDTPVDTSEFQHMKILFKSPEPKLVGLRIRIIDANCTHWAYGETLSYEKENLSTNSNVWKTVIIPLRENRWFHFPYDGYPPREGQRLPNVDAINLISFEVGLEGTTAESLATLTKLEVNNDEPAIIDIKPVEFC